MDDLDRELIHVDSMTWSKPVCLYDHRQKLLDELFSARSLELYIYEQELKLFSSGDRANDINLTARVMPEQ